LGRENKVGDNEFVEIKVEDRHQPSVETDVGALYGVVLTGRKRGAGGKSWYKGTRTLVRE